MDLESTILALNTLYGTSTAEEKFQANLWLQKFRKSSFSWNICAEIIKEPTFPNEQKIFAAQTIAYKARRQPNPPSPEEIDGLLRTATQFLSAGLTPIATQLVLAACAAMVRNSHCNASTLIQDVVQFCTQLQSQMEQHTHAHQPPDILLLLVLTILPEEASSFKGTPQRRIEVVQQLCLQVPSLLLPLINEKILMWGKAGATVLVGQALNCLSNWQVLQGSMTWDGLQQFPSLFEAAFLGLLYNDGSISEQSCDFLCMVFDVCASLVSSEAASNLVPKTAELFQHLHCLTTEESALRVCTVVSKCGNCFLSCFDLPELMVHWDSIIGTLLQFTAAPSFLVCTQSLTFWHNLCGLSSRSIRVEEKLTESFLALVKRASFPNNFESSSVEERDEVTELRRQIRDVFREICRGQSRIAEWYLEHALAYLSKYGANENQWQETEAHLHALSALAKNLCTLQKTPSLVELFSNLSGHPAVQRSAGLIVAGIIPVLQPATGHEPVMMITSIQLAVQTLKYSDDMKLSFPMTSQEDHICSVCLFKIFRAYSNGVLLIDGILQLVLQRYKDVWSLQLKQSCPLTEASFLLLTRAIAFLGANQAASEVMANSLIEELFVSMERLQSLNQDSALWTAFKAIGILIGATKQSGLMRMRERLNSIHQIVWISLKKASTIEHSCSFFQEISLNTMMTPDDAENAGKIVVQISSEDPHPSLLRMIQPLLQSCHSAVWSYFVLCADTVFPALQGPADGSNTNPVAIASYYEIMKNCVEQVPQLTLQILQRAIYTCCCCMRGKDKVSNQAALNFLQACCSQQNAAFKTAYSDMMRNGLGENVMYSILEAVIGQMPSDMLNDLVNTLQVMYICHGSEVASEWIWKAIHLESFKMNSSSDKRKKEFVESVQQAMCKDNWRMLKVAVKSFCGGKRKQARKHIVLA